MHSRSTRARSTRHWSAWTRKAGSRGRGRGLNRAARRKITRSRRLARARSRNRPSAGAGSPASSTGCCWTSRSHVLSASLCPPAGSVHRRGPRRTRARQRSRRAPEAARAGVFSPRPPAGRSTPRRPRAFGNVESAKEQQRDARSFTWMEDVRRDIAYGIRALARTPGFTAVAVITLALGIGAVTVIYSVLRNVVLDPFPYTLGSHGQCSAEGRVRSHHPRSLLPGGRVPRLRGTGDRVRRCRRYQPAGDALDDRVERGALDDRVDDPERVQLPWRRPSAGPGIRRGRCRAWCAARRRPQPSDVGEAVRRGSGCDWPHARARRRTEDDHRRHAAAVRMEHRGSLAAIVSQPKRRSSIGQGDACVPGALATRRDAAGGGSPAQRHRGASSSASTPATIRPNIASR